MNLVPESNYFPLMYALSYVWQYASLNSVFQTRPQLHIVAIYESWGESDTQRLSDNFHLLVVGRSNRLEMTSLEHMWFCGAVMIALLMLPPSLPAVTGFQTRDTIFT